MVHTHEEAAPLLSLLLLLILKCLLYVLILIVHDYFNLL
jgi:hypothetical protein